jgi:hypothetical protein
MHLLEYNVHAMDSFLHFIVPTRTITFQIFYFLLTVGINRIHFIHLLSYLSFLLMTTISSYHSYLCCTTTIDIDVCSTLCYIL